MIEEGEMNSKYKLITLSMDGTHNLIQVAKSNSQKWYSYKLKDCAYNILVTLNKISIFNIQI